MANPCRFQWLIRNPDLPWRNFEATFYHGSPTTTQWRVTLQPVDNRVNLCSFSFSLKFDESFEITAHDFKIKAEKVMVRIMLNGALVEEKETPFEFNTGNQFTYGFHSVANFYPQKQPHLLDITVEISLPGRVMPSDPGNGLCTGDDDLAKLSESLMLLVGDSQYSNMSLVSRDGQHSIRVHNYILDARWNNFFKRHDFQEGRQDTVHTNISEGLLLDILTYMYSGQLATSRWPDWTKAAYTTELFQVIDWYKLYHFYKVFVKKDLTQLRETSNRVLVQSHFFPLDSINDRPINNASNTWQANLDSEHRFIFHIQARKDNRCGPWLSYSLQSESRSRVSVKMTLEVVRKLGRNDPERVSSFHESECTLDPDASVKSGPVLFLGCPETFDPTSSEETEIKYFIRCYLCVSDGTTVIRESGVDDFTPQNDLERFRVLSDHMDALQKQSTHADMTIYSRPWAPGDPDQYEFQWRIHKGIFASRVPDYWEGLLDVPPENDVPDLAKSILNNEILQIVLDYLYTGKVSTIPDPYLDAIADFAERTKFSSLKSLIDRIRSRSMEPLP